MSTQLRTQSVIGLVGLIVVTMACGFPLATLGPTAQPNSAAQITPTATAQPDNATPMTLAATVTPAPGQSAGGSAGGTGSGNGGDGGSGSKGGNNGGTDGSTDVTATPTQLPDIHYGPYLVKQIETLGGESISGFVCSLTQPFTVLSTTPKVTFTFVFVPQDAQRGKVTYTYSIPKAGESHNAAGTYTLALLDKVGTQQLSLTVSDHVVFKGFDGNIPLHYRFNLVPSTNASCPHA
ncbi:MAG: hypothetical protein M1434_15455 [Chloroflexi bacterium]|nr:hypothetical protein [Chloroflexota bacterium]MCL5276117.1 hypothetical protein [Chloroflexota bacterium]